VVGMYVVSDSLIRNGKLINDEVLTYSNGFAKSIKTISSKKEGEFWLVNAEVEVVVGKVIKKLRDIQITTISGPGEVPIFAGTFTDVDKFRKVFKKIALDPIFKDGSAYKREFLSMEPYLDDRSSGLKEGQHIYQFIANDKDRYESMKVIPFAMKFRVSLSDEYINQAKNFYNYLSGGDIEEKTCKKKKSPKKNEPTTDCCNVSSVCIVELTDPPREKSWLVGSKVTEYKFSSVNNRVVNNELLKIRNLYDISRHSGAYFSFEFLDKDEKSIGSVVLGGIDTCKSIKDAKKYSKCKKDRGVVSGSHYSSTPIITPYEAWGDPWHKGVLPMISGFYINKKALISNQQEFVVIVLIDEEDAKMIKDVKSSINWKKPNIQ